MRNPWLDVPLPDYEAHMSLPAVGQAQALAEVLSQLIELCAPASVAIIGCAGGNGFEHLASRRLARVVGVDINPHYLDETARRFSDRIEGLELHCTDIQCGDLQFEPVDLIYAALLFEYVDPAPALATLRRNCRSGGTLATVLQLPHASLEAISPSPYTSLRTLASGMKLVEPADLARYAAAAGFAPDTSEVLILPSGKRFSLQRFRG